MANYDFRDDLIVSGDHRSIFDHLVSVISPDLKAFLARDPLLRDALFNADAPQSGYSKNGLMLCRNKIYDVYLGYREGIPVDGTTDDTLLIRANRVRNHLVKLLNMSPVEIKMLLAEQKKAEECGEENHETSEPDYTQTQNAHNSQEPINTDDTVSEVSDAIDPNAELADDENNDSFVPPQDMSSDILGLNATDYQDDYSDELPDIPTEDSNQLEETSEEAPEVAQEDVPREDIDKQTVQDSEKIDEEIVTPHTQVETKEEKPIAQNEVSHKEPIREAPKKSEPIVSEKKSAPHNEISLDAPVKINVNIFGDYDSRSDDSEEEKDPFVEAMYADEAPKAKAPTLNAAVSFKKNETFEEYGVSESRDDEYQQDVVLGLPSDGINLEELDLKKENVASAKLIEYIINQDKKMNILTARITKIEEQMPHTGMLDIGSMYKVFDQRIELYRFNKHFLTIPNRFHNFGYRTEVTSMKFFVEHEGENWVVGMGNSMPSANENIPVYSYQNDPVRFEKILQKLLAKL